MEANQTNEKQDRVSRDTIFSQMSSAAVRHRNYEKEVAAWYTAILSALFGFVLSSKFQVPASSATHPLSDNVLAQMILTGVVLAIGLSSSYSIWFFHVQHTCFDRYVDSLLDAEQTENKAFYLRGIPKLKPSRLMIAVQLLIAVGTIVLVFLEP